MTHPRRTTTTTQIRHDHQINHQARPARKMLGALPQPRLGMILLPRETGALPLAVHILDQIPAEAHVDASGLLLLRSGSLSHLLNILLANLNPGEHKAEWVGSKYIFTSKFLTIR